MWCPYLRRGITPSRRRTRRPRIHNFRATINGFQYANLPMMTMEKGERVRWYVVTLGEGLNLHTPHWHGNVVVQNGKRTDVIFIAPVQMETVDMAPTIPASGCFTAILTTIWTREWLPCTRSSLKGHSTTIPEGSEF